MCVSFVFREENCTVNSAILKELTGGDEISGRRLYDKEMDTFIFRALPVVLCNTMPNVNDRTNAMWRRIVSVPFQAKFVTHPRPEVPQERLMDPNICERFQEWKDVFATFLVDQRYTEIMQNEDYLEIPEHVINNTKTYQRDTDYIADFIQECLEVTNKKEDFASWAHLVHPEFKRWFKAACPNDKEPNQIVIRNLLKGALKLEYGFQYAAESKKPRPVGRDYAC